MSKVFAHRGFSGKYPENTMLAFQKAVELGVDGIELDVHFSKDGKLVVIHDEKIDRTCDGTGNVKDYTLAELRSLDASYLYRGQYGVCQIPTLEEYFELVRDLPLVTNIELKTNIYEYDGIEQKVYDEIRRCRLEDRVIVSSFNHYSVLRMKEIAPELKYGLLSESWMVGAGEYCRRLGIPCYHPLRGNLIPPLVKDLKDHGLEINTYTVNEEEEVRRFYALEIDGIIGNFPDMTKRVLLECAEGTK
ncbi:MAG: glycerophosphodiester phosphodiesterase [Oscillospiraceae bacterium]|nr:glycerophosphodiester phosphodiesterase [Oscillospiraceae bacterium]